MAHAVEIITCERQGRQYYTLNIIVAEDLATDGGDSSTAAVVCTEISRNIPVS